MTDKELMQQALTLLRKVRGGQTILADHQRGIEAALEARINDQAHGLAESVLGAKAMEPRIIKTEADYEAGMAALDALLDLDPAPGTPEYDQLDRLAMRLEQYEVKMMAEQKFGGEARSTTPKEAVVTFRELVDTTYNYNLPEAVAQWEAANPEPEDPRKMTVICWVEGTYVPFNRVVLPASLTEVLMYWPCAVELCARLNDGETL